MSSTDAAAPTDPVAPVGGRRLHSLQILRGAAAAMVVISHIVEHPLPVVPEAAHRTGRLGVDLFFVISGIIIAEVAGDGPFHPGRFLAHRFFRVVPLYWVTTLLVAGCALWFPALFKTTTFEVTAFLKSMAFVPGPDPQDINDWRPTYKLGWTLNYEVFFYAVMLLLFWCRSATARCWGMTAVFGALIAIGFLPHEGKSILFFYANLNVLPFLVGVWISRFRRVGALDGWGGAALATLALGAAAALTAFYVLPLRDLSDVGPHLLMTLAATLPLVLGLVVERRIDWRPAGWLEAIGDSSYSLYLVHMFIVGAGAAVLHRLGLHGAAFWAPMALVFPLCLVAATLSYRFLEVPINRIGKGFGRESARRPGAAARAAG